mgnify:FL=1
MIGQVSFRSGFSLFLPEDDPYRLMEERVAEAFSQDDLVIVAIDVEELISPGALRRISALVEEAQDVAGTASVVSLTNLQDLYLRDGVLEQEPVYRPQEDPEAQALSERVLGTPLFREFFVSADEQALYTYIVPDPDINAAEYGEALISALDSPDRHFFGDAIAKAYVSRAVMEELVLLGTLALIVVLIVEIIISRSLIIGLVLSLVSMVPAVWTLAFFPLLGSAVESTTMMVPVIVLVIATSYGIHIFRYHALGYGDMGDTLQHVGQVVLAAGFTTMLGFVSLLVTPSRILTHLGTLIIFGIFASLVTSLLLLPPLLSILSGRIRRRVHPDGDGAGSGEPRRRFDRRALEKLMEPPRRPILRLTVAGLLLIAFVALIPRVQAGYSARDTFRGRTDIARAVSYFQARAEASHDMEVYLDTGQEYGLVYLDAYEELREIDQMLEADPAVARSFSYVDFVEFMLGRLEGRLEPVEPESEAEIGEAMELLSGRSVGLSFNALVDDGWQRTRFLFQASFPAITDPDGVSAVEELLDRIRGFFGASAVMEPESGERQVGFEPADFTSGAVLGVPVENLQHITYLSRSQILSLMAFAPIIVGFLILVFRSVPWAFITLLPTVAGVIVYFGMLGLTGFLHDPIHVFMVAALMGISNDDVLYFVLVFRREAATQDYAGSLRTTVHKTGGAIVQTTLIIAAGVAVFYFSRFILLGRAGLVMTISLLAASATTLTVIPAILKATPRLLRRPEK